MRKLIAVMLIFVALVSAASPQASAQKKAKKLKEKRFEPAVKESVTDYAGRYIGVEPSYVLEVRVGEDNRLTGYSAEGDRRATLREIKVEGSHLTATKVYSDGTTARFAGEFVNRIVNGQSAFGIIVEGMRIELGSATLTRVFYRRTSPSDAR